MAITRTGFARTTILLLVAGAITLAGIVGATLWLVAQTTDHSAQIVREQQIRSEASALLAMMQAAETGQRGFIITRDERYLEPYLLVHARIPSRIERLRSLYPAGSPRLEEIDRLEELVTTQLKELADTVALVREGRPDDAIAFVRSEAGKAPMDAIRDILRAFFVTVDRNIAGSIAASRASSTALTWTVIAGALMIALVAGGSVWISIGHMRELVAARQELEQLNFSLEERVGDRTSELARANDEIQRFAYIVSHDLRAPLVNVMGFTSELEACLASIQRHVEATEAAAPPDIAAEARTAAFEDLPEALRFIRSSTNRMDRLINAILKLSREGRRTLAAERIDMAALLEAAAGSVQHQIQETDGSITVVKPVPNIVADRLAVEQVFGNLIDNAAKYLNPDRPGRIVLRGHEQGSRLVFEVEDNGRGIAAQDHERVFELFRRSGSQDQPGEGIGLAHVRTLARRMGGDVTIDSELGRGTIFRVVLPRRAPSFATDPDNAASR